ncbi:hypothetical protein P4C99_19470 [Pontiellaceae bacterium B1224]|nr:hypothetical protein [Pontiellaceae bacterium B1224]
MKSQPSPLSTQAKKCASSLSKWCAYKHLYTVISTLIRGGKMSDQTRAGRNIALLGLFCPFFWIALFTGVHGKELALHAAHSGIVFFIGLSIVIVSLIKPK